MEYLIKKVRFEGIRFLRSRKSFATAPLDIAPGCSWQRTPLFEGKLEGWVKDEQGHRRINEDTITSIV
jgi:hypothetical protein